MWPIHWSGTDQCSLPRGARPTRLPLKTRTNSSQSCAFRRLFVVGINSLVVVRYFLNLYSSTLSVRVASNVECTSKIINNLLPFSSLLRRGNQCHRFSKWTLAIATAIQLSHYYYYVVDLCYCFLYKIFVIIFFPCVFILLSLWAADAFNRTPPTFFTGSLISSIAIVNETFKTVKT